MHLKSNLMFETLASRQCLVSLIHVFSKIICFPDPNKVLMLGFFAKRKAQTRMNCKRKEKYKIEHIKETVMLLWCGNEEHYA